MHVPPSSRLDAEHATSLLLSIPLATDPPSSSDSSESCRVAHAGRAGMCTSRVILLTRGSWLAPAPVVGHQAALEAARPRLGLRYAVGPRP